MGLRGPGSKKRKAGRDGVSEPPSAPAWKRKRTRVARLIAFLEELKVTKGKCAGQKLKLTAEQRAFVRAVYGSTPRTVRLAISSVPRGGGKTTFCAALCAAHLYGPEAEPRGECYSGAADKLQATLIYKELAAFIEADPEVAARCNVQRFHKLVEILQGDGAGSTYEALSADAKRPHGLAPSFFVIDEPAQAKSAELFEGLLTGTGKRDEALGLVIGTQAATDQHWYSVLIDDAASGEDPSQYLQLICAPEDADPLDEATWHACNPALKAGFLDLEEFRSEARRAARVPSFMPRFQNLRLNMRVEAEERFLAAADWKACKSIGADPFGPCFLGLDLSSTTDLTALAAYWPDTGCARTWAWAPKDTLEEAERRDGVPYTTWAWQGLLETTPGRAIDKAFVVHRLGEIVAEHDVTACAFDRWRIDEIMRLLADADIKLKMEPWGQGFKDMSPALDALEALVVQGRLKHPGNPVLDWAVANAVTVHDPAGNRKVDKAKSTGRIDPLVALAMAIGLATRTTPKKPSVYSTRGLMTVGIAV